MNTSGTYSGWPFHPVLVNAPEGPSLVGGEGDAGPDGAEVYIATRHIGATSALAVSNIQQTADDSGCAIEAHMFASAGTAEKSATQFPLWLTCQLWSRWDAT